jgi:hypothetical protein
MEWRYYGITLTGLKKTGNHTLEKYLEQVRRTIQDNRWTQQLPAIRSGVFERTTAYVFLAHVEDPDDLPDDVPPPVQEVFQAVRYVGGLIRPTRKGGHTLEEIRSITRGALTTDSIGSLNSLFRDLALVDVRIPPLDLSASEEEFLDASNPGLARRHDCLLTYLSACGEGSWERFVRAAVALGLAKADQHLRLRSLIRRLVLLGHVQTSFDQQRWSVCPLTLVTRESEPGAFILCGSRTARVLSDLEQHLGAPERIGQPLDDGPECLVFRAAPEKLATVTHAGGLAVSQSGSFATRLAAVLPDYQGWLASLPTDGSLRMASFPDCRRFDGSEFVAVACPHQEGERVVGQPGLYEFTPPEGALLFRYLDASGAWRTGDYHALRYAGTVAGRGRTIAKALHACQLAVPLSQRWPLLHERCLVLANGRLPAWISDHQWLKYTGVSRELLDSLQGKLSFDIEETDDA